MNDKSETLRERIIQFYKTTKIVKFDRETIFALIFVLRSINYKYNASFYDEISRNSAPEIQKKVYKAFAEANRIDFSKDFLKDYKNFGKTVFFTLLNLDIQISKRLKAKMTVVLPKLHAKLLASYFDAYFCAIREHRLEEIMGSNKKLRDNWFNNTARIIRNRQKDFEMENNLRSKRPELFLPNSSAYSRFSESRYLTFVSTPMGGMNKQY